MADVVTFDPINLRIIEIDTALASNAIDIREIYSEWKDWLLADSSRKGYPQAFRVVGGDPVSGTDNLGSTFFILYPWKIRPAENDHRLTLNGNIFTDPAGESPTVTTLGPYTVAIELKVSTLVEEVNVGGGGATGADSAEAQMNVAYDESIVQLYMEIWLDRNGESIPAANLVSCTVDVYDDTAALVFSAASVTPDANGRFSLTETPVTLNAHRPYNATVTVVDNLGSVTTYQAFTAVG